MREALGVPGNPWNQLSMMGASFCELREDVRRAGVPYTLINEVDDLVCLSIIDSEDLSTRISRDVE